MLIRHTILYLPAQILGPLFQFLSIIAWTHYASLGCVGTLTLITASHELVQTAFMAWWSQYTLRFSNSLKSSEDRALFQRTENFVVLASIFCQVPVGLIILYFWIDTGASCSLALATAGYIATRSANIFFSERARAREQIFLYTLQQTSGPVLGFGLGLIMLIDFGSDPLWPLTGFLIAQAIAAVCAIAMSDFGRDFGRPSQRVLRDAMNYGLPLVGSNFATWITLNGSRFIVEWLLGAAAAGLFAVGFGLGQRAGAVSAMLVTAAAFPLAVKRHEGKDEAGAMRQLSDNAALLFAVLLPTCAGLAALRHDVVATLIGQSFREAASTILPLSVALGAIRNLRAHFIDQIFLLNHRTDVILKITFFEAFFAVVCGIWGTLIWGVAGAAAGVLVATVLGFAASAAVAWRHYRLVIPSWDLLKITCAALLMAGILSLLPQALNWPQLLAKIGAGVLINITVLAGLYNQSIRRQFLTA